jgi:stearoyl-CoA desaturase (delta-9 desaturase)
VRWVIIHRLHHQYSDERPDPHSPLVTFLWAHVGWLFLKNHQVDSAAGYDKYGRDILKDPFYRFLERHHMWVWINGLQALLFVAGGALGGYWWTGTTAGAIQQAASVFVWGVIVRTVVVWHITWSVNSLTHVWGYKNYPTDDNSRNNWLVGWVAMGEGWHNNHHADQRSAAHGHKWWEFDATWWTVRALEIVGLAKEVVRPRLPA